MASSDHSPRREQGDPPDSIDHQGHDEPSHDSRGRLADHSGSENTVSAHDDTAAAPSASPSPAPATRETVLYRRAPKLSVFLILGGLLGAVLGMFVGVVGPGNVMFTTGQVVGYMIVIFTILGISAGAVVALVIDRISLGRAREIDARVETHPDERPTKSPGPAARTVGDDVAGRDDDASAAVDEDAARDNEPDVEADHVESPDEVPEGSPQEVPGETRRGHDVPSSHAAIDRETAPEQVHNPGPDVRD